MLITSDLQVKNYKLPIEVKEKYLSVPGYTGLVLRVRPGRKDWYFRWRPQGGTVRKIALGQYPMIGLSEARQKSEALRKQRAEGIDPQAERLRIEVEKAAAAALADALPQTLPQLFDLWRARELGRGRKDGGAETLRKFQKDVYPALGEIPLSQIRRAHVMAVLDSVRARAPRIAGMILSELRQMYAFAIEREIVEIDPTAGIKRAKLGGNAAVRKRVLSPDEIQLLAEALPLTMSERAQHVLWIMLSTCCRIGEVSAAEWDDVDLDAAEWRIPPENAKNGSEHHVFLSKFALFHFKKLHELRLAAAESADTLPSPWVVPARHHSGSVCPKSITKQVADRQRGADGAPLSRRSPMTSALILPGGQWQPHDLRRTGATLMESLGLDRRTVKHCLNQQVDGDPIANTYQHHAYTSEMRAAWLALSDRLTEILAAPKS